MIIQFPSIYDISLFLNSFTVQFCFDLNHNELKVKASDILDQWLGGSEAAIRSIFARARSAAPCALFFDEIDALATNREDDDVGSSSDVHSRILSTLLNEMDGISKDDSIGTQKNVLVIAATNRLEAIDAALLRPGRLQEHILIDLPTLEDCTEIFSRQVESWSLDDDVNIDEIVKNLFSRKASGADIDGFCREACLNAIRMGIEKIQGDTPNFIVSKRNFEEILSRS